MKINTVKTCREVDDGRILRLWYLPNVWEKALERDFKERLEGNDWKNTSEWEKVEKDLFSSVKNKERFGLLLRNYKKDEVDKIILVKK